MLYSTCTFAPIENEGTISYILENFPEMELLEIPAYEDSQREIQNGNGDDTLKDVCVFSRIRWQEKGILLHC